jgi:hypothetical protein
MADNHGWIATRNLNLSGKRGALTVGGWFATVLRQWSPGAIDCSTVREHSWGSLGHVRRVQSFAPTLPETSAAV